MSSIIYFVVNIIYYCFFFFFFQAEDGIRDLTVTGVQTCALPILPSHPDHALAKEQMRGFGSMLAFDVKGGLPAARRFCDRVQLFLLAASLGGVESLVILPAYSSHYNMTDEELRRAGVSPGTVRVSIGLEDKEDLIEDLKQALS